MAAGKEIKRLRGKTSARVVADLIGVGVDKLRKWEERDADPSDSGDIEKVERYFGLSLNQLAGLKNFDFVQISRGTEHQKDELIKSLRDQIQDLKDHNQTLKDQVNSLKGQFRHLLLLTLAKVTTNQNALADLLVKQKIAAAKEVEDRLGKENDDYYESEKNELGIA